MELTMKIKNVKCIKELEFTFPLDSGIYAITGENGSGKSTLITCASTVFYQMAMNDYFGKPKAASIEFKMGTATRLPCTHAILKRGKRHLANYDEILLI